MDISVSEPAKSLSVGILPIQGFALLSFAGVVDPFRFANGLSGRVLYDVSIIGGGRRDIESSGPAVVRSDTDMTSDLTFDYLFVIAGGRPEEFEDQKTLNWIAGMARKGTCIAGVSGGPVLLAKAGVVAGRRMTVHWEHAPNLVESFPELLLEKTLFTRDRSLITCGGGAASLDMTLALIQQDHGSELVRQVSDWCLHTDIREASSAQRKAVSTNIGPANAVVLLVASAMEENIAVPLSLAQLSEIGGVSGRHLNRIFKRATGETVAQFYRNIRLDFAMNLLRASALTITQIAIATGFSGSSHFTSSFQSRFGRLPSSIRA